MKVRITAMGTWLLVAACGSGGGESIAHLAPGESPARMTPISEIQGPGDDSPLLGQNVSISAIVTGDFQDDEDRANNLGGFYVQQESTDSDSATSDGVFIYDGNNPRTNVSVGDRVDIAGTVKEYFGETQIQASSVTVTGTGSIRATDVSLPLETTGNSEGERIADLERFEGMLIRFPQTLTVSNLYYLERYGEVGLSQGGRQFHFTNGNAPDVTAYEAYVDSLAARTVVLDDGLRASNPDTIRHLYAGPGVGYSIRTGDSITGATGNLRYSKGSGGGGLERWRLMPTETATFNGDNPRPTAPLVAGSIRVASFNVLNFFSNIDTGESSCGPQRNQNCRGANSAAELSRQLKKIVTALVMMDADIVGLVELENDATESLSIIVDALNDRLGTDAYTYVNTGTIHTDAIKAGFIFSRNTVRATGPFAVLNSNVDPSFDDSRNRPALAQSFELIDGGAIFTVVVNHLKSKASNCDSNGDPRLGDGQSNCNRSRTAAAAAMADWLGRDPTNSGDTDFLIIGDLNAYTLEDPLTALKDAGLTNLLEAKTGAYSYQFSGRSGVIDHAVASPSLVSQVRETMEWHINADEPQLLDYNLDNGRDSGLFDPDTPYRASDHDPIIIGLDLVN